MNPTPSTGTRCAENGGENCAEKLAQLAAVERLCAFIDSLCVMLLAEFLPRTWLGALLHRHVSHPLADKLAAALHGMSERMREIAAEILAGGGVLPERAEMRTTDGGGGARTAPTRRGAMPSGSKPVGPSSSLGSGTVETPADADQAPAARPDVGGRDKRGHDREETNTQYSGGFWAAVDPTAPAATDGQQRRWTCRDGPPGGVFSPAEGLRFSRGHFVTYF